MLLGGFNDSAEDARRVVRLVSGMRAKVNLIPWNPGELPYRAPEPERVEEFRRVANGKGRARVCALFARAGHHRRLRPAGADRNSRRSSDRSICGTALTASNPRKSRAVIPFT